MNALNRFLSYDIALLVSLADRQTSSALRAAVIQIANAQRQRVAFLLYRIGLGALQLLGFAKTGIQGWFRIGQDNYQQLEMCI